MTTRVFRGPAPDGYGDARDTPASEQLVPLFAPKEFSLRLEDLDIEDLDIEDLDIA
jgi:hypothetical protein